MKPVVFSLRPELGPTQPSSARFFLARHVVGFEPGWVTHDFLCIIFQAGTDFLDKKFQLVISA